jgi:hypothetical protein
MHARLLLLSGYMDTLTAVYIFASFACSLGLVDPRTLVTRSLCTNTIKAKVPVKTSLHAKRSNHVVRVVFAES